MNITLIGPVYPYKGGISQYTGLLYRTLSEKNNVRMVSYKMQYPKILFKKEQRDYSNDTFKIDDAEFLINTANIFNILRVGRQIKKSNPDMVIIQWWHPYFAPCYKLLEWALGKNTKIVFTCHNVFPHERFPMDKALTKMVLKRGDGFIVHSKRDGEDLEGIKKDANFKFNPHPTYNAFKIRNISREQAIEEIVEKDGFKIGNDSQLLLFFGFVKKYKGLQYMLEAMPHIKEKLPNCRLLVVGSFGDDKQDYLNIIKEKNIGDVVYLKDDYTPDNEIEKYFAAANLITLPYIDATQSGIVQIAYGFEKPVIVTRVGGLPDVVTDGKTGYVVKKEDASSLADGVVKYFSEEKEEEFSKNVRDEAYKFSWERMVESIMELG